MHESGFPLPIRSTRSSRSPNFPTKPDQARLKRVNTTSSRPLADNTRPPHDSFTTSTQSSFRFPLNHLDLYDRSSTKWTSARSPPDLHKTRS
ncbi:hypothetical protein DPMN_012758 [Dreissena polymorpha]|uniref:Uncharacterized protein n=1 Tax=Dreissena polymorpha TaxID=45954 RepID=A0A9D4S344_DREPO|nr:hypothetical protein DPMN_012758 [Dreissena polymorpha]